MSSFTFDFGKHMWEPLAEIPASYLKWAVESCDRLEPWERTEIQQELRRRKAGGWSTDKAKEGYSRKDWEGEHPRTDGATSFGAVAAGLAGQEATTALEIVRAGRRTLAQRHHPDVGGKTEAMKAINCVADKLESRLKLLGGER